MSKGRVLVIDDDEWVCRLLAVAMKEAGFEITITENAADGFFKAVEEQPDCIVCDVDLPDQNGYWVAKKIRSHPSKISSAPFVFLSGLDDREHRLEGFQVGGDAYLTKPFRIDEVVAQVDALIQMAVRLRKSRQTLASIPPPGEAMRGDLAQMSLGTLLTLIDLERRSGKLQLHSAGKKAQFTLEGGNVASTTLNGASVSPLEAIRTAMGWATGKFSFVPHEPSLTVTAESAPINALLMEAARLEDEARADEKGRPSSSRLASWKESIARSSQRPVNATPPPPSTAPSAPPSDDGGSLSIFPSEPAPAGAPSEPAAAISPKPPAVLPAPPKPPAITTPSAQASPIAVRAPLGQTPLGQTPRVGAVAPRTGASSTTSLPAVSSAAKPAAAPVVPAAKPTPQAGPKLGLPAPNPRLPKPPLPAQRTGFGQAMRSLSPAKPMRAVTPPLGTPKAVETPAPPSPPSVPPESADTGWSVPPPPPADDKDKKPADETPGRSTPSETK